jgi:hypothetical protein
MARDARAGADDARTAHGTNAHHVEGLRDRRAAGSRRRHGEGAGVTRGCVADRTDDRTTGGDLPAGQVPIEPYRFDAISEASFDSARNRPAGPCEHTIGSQTHMLFGLSDRITAG